MPASPAVIVGRVIGPGGKPIANARVYFTRGPVPLPEIAALTDDSGGFSLTAPAPGKYVLAAAAEGLTDSSATVEVGKGREANVDIKLKK